MSTFRGLLHDLDPEVLFEAAFSEKNLAKVTQLYSKIMGKRLGGEFKSLGVEKYKRSMGTGQGMRTMNDAGEMLRFNWDDKLGKKSKSDLTSIDYWDSGNKDFQKPTRTVKLGPEMNVVQVLDEITIALKTGKVNEARTGREKKEWLKQQGMPDYISRSDKEMRARAGKEGKLAELEVFLGSSEKNTFEGGLQEAQKAFDDTIYADPDTVFEDIEDLLTLVAEKKWRTLIVCGQGGIGKTYHITEGDRSLSTLLGPKGEAWTYHSGPKAAPFSFYKTLFSERDKIIVFDESDSLLKNDDIVMMLKPILDTSGDNMAAYMSNTRNMVGMSNDEIEEYSRESDERIAAGERVGPGKKDVNLPSKFSFTGGMVFISNMPATGIEKAIMSRSIFVDVHLAAQDVTKRDQAVLDLKADKSATRTRAQVAMVMKALGAGGAGKEVEVNYMTAEHARKSKELTIRAGELGMLLLESGLKNWERLAAFYA